MSVGRDTKFVTRSRAGEVLSVFGQQYRIGRKGRTWTADLWCDCAMGPHWHEVAECPSRTALVEALREQS